MGKVIASTRDLLSESCEVSLDAVAEDEGAVVVAVASTVEKGDVTRRGRLGDRLPRLRGSVELGLVAAAELLPLRHVVAVPPAQLGAGRCLLEPDGGQVVASHPAGPQALDEEGLAGELTLVVVDAGEVDLPPGGPARASCTRSSRW